MPCMKMCCFRFSTRLGSILIGILTIIQVLLSLTALFVAGGTDMLQNVASRIKSPDDETDKKDGLMWLMGWLKIRTNEIHLTLITFLGAHALCCVIMIVGAFVMYRYLLFPFMVLDFIKVCILTMIHVVAMMIIKEGVNLGDLIALTIAGGFALLLLFYLWACVVSLFQILGIVKTEKYRALFGDDPTAPVEVAVTRIPDSVHNFKVSLVHPVSSEAVNNITYNTSFGGGLNKDSHYNYIP
ncbi:uncharacterized protein LOC131433155 [Malaya genurostris]|uniref:uncharacterized protein LOC131433155 n=1 Tax=Malaya genurostris TaxID=325434 RepID=UPI0026F3BB67|nr:uncharacterized protein LOC131433155 [Malaya genurostris]XP_058455976.1 uncharacterized protein LOC131433155 [Malaya genurostris]XP_058455978.1 uncharacterized protein LOC131433155 [Malaya genurostris]XP_058455979.1 uncharacterized protein LOC131433155 [Malaya genurostris]XP_058455980.1 uncharacterized protein LOC131433155 [Malaya genurostris]